MYNIYVYTWRNRLGRVSREELQVINFDDVSCRQLYDCKIKWSWQSSWFIMNDIFREYLWHVSIAICKSQECCFFLHETYSKLKWIKTQLLNYTAMYDIYTCKNNGIMKAKCKWSLYKTDSIFVRSVDSVQIYRIKFIDSI